MRRIEDAIESLPAAPADKPVEQWTIPELLNENVRQGLLQASCRSRSRSRRAPKTN